MFYILEIFLESIFKGQGPGKPMEQNNGNRIGDSINVSVVVFKAFFENSLDRSRVFYRLMLIKCAKGDTIDRGTLFKDDSGNKRDPPGCQQCW